MAPKALLGRIIIEPKMNQESSVIAIYNMFASNVTDGTPATATAPATPPTPYKELWPQILASMSGKGLDAMGVDYEDREKFYKTSDPVKCRDFIKGIEFKPFLCDLQSL